MDLCSAEEAYRTNGTKCVPLVSAAIQASIVAGTVVFMIEWCGNTTSDPVGNRSACVCAMQGSDKANELRSKPLIRLILMILSFSSREAVGVDRLRQSGHTAPDS